MVGSVLLERMRAERDFELVEPVFFSTSQAGGAAPAPAIGRATRRHGAGRQRSRARSRACRCSSAPRAAITRRPCTRGCARRAGRATGSTRPRRCVWIRSAVIVLDPVNLPVMQAARERGIKDFIGGNCTVSLMLMAVCGLLRAGLVEWITAMTYQSASGAGAQNMRELLEQMGCLYQAAAPLLRDPASSILDIDRAVGAALGSEKFPRTQFGAPLAASLIPWIDKDLGNGQSREEWKAGVGVEQDHGHGGEPGAGGRHLRAGECHALPFAGAHHQAEARRAARRDRALDRRRQFLGEGGAERARRRRSAALAPAAVSGTIGIPIGRLRKLAMGGEYLSAFTVGDQLLWGAAEPLRRTMRFLLDCSCVSS